MRSSKVTSDHDLISLPLDEWFYTGLGSEIAREECKVANHCLKDQFGYLGFQYGLIGQKYWLAASQTQKQIYSAKWTEAAKYLQDNSLAAELPLLPFTDSMVDLVVLPHALESENDPGGALNEAVRVLSAEGHIAIIGFNPWSLMGLQKCLGRSNKVFMKHKWHKIYKIRSLLDKENCEIIQVSTHYFKPLLNSPLWRERFSFLQNLGQMLTPNSGSLYFILARKKEARGIPIRTKVRLFERFRRCARAAVNNIGHSRHGN